MEWEPLSMEHSALLVEPGGGTPVCGPPLVDSSMVKKRAKSSNGSGKRVKQSASLDDWPDVQSVYKYLYGSSYFDFESGNVPAFLAALPPVLRKLFDRYPLSEVSYTLSGVGLREAMRLRSHRNLSDIDTLPWDEMWREPGYYRGIVLNVYGGCPTGYGPYVDFEALDSWCPGDVLLLGVALFQLTIWRWLTFLPPSMKSQMLGRTDQ